MTSRYYVPDLPLPGGEIELPETEAHHAVSVMRIKPGAEVVLFDGKGNEAVATIRSVGRREVHCAAAAAQYRPRRNALELHLGVAMPKGDRSRELVERLTELGVDRLTPLRAERSPWELSESAIAKWQRVVIEACKQSRRNERMGIDPPCRTSDWWAGDGTEVAARWIAHPGGRPLAELLRNLPTIGGGAAERVVGEAISEPTERAGVRIAIGPEGGFSAAEVAAAEQAGWTKVDLGDRIYRIETAAVVLAAAVAVAGRTDLEE